MAVFSLILLGVSISYNNTSNVASDTDSSLVADSDLADDESTDTDEDDDDIFADEESEAESSDDGSVADLESERQTSESLAQAESESQAQAEQAQANDNANNSQAGNAPVNNGDMNTADANAQGTIVGNSRSMIYHVPGQRGYRMNSENAVYFSTEAEAQAAGYRRSLR